MVGMIRMGMSKGHVDISTFPFSWEKRTSYFPFMYILPEPVAAVRPATATRGPEEPPLGRLGNPWGGVVVVVIGIALPCCWERSDEVDGFFTPLLPPLLSRRPPLEGITRWGWVYGKWWGVFVGERKEGRLGEKCEALGGIIGLLESGTEGLPKGVLPPPKAADRAGPRTGGWWVFPCIPG